LSKRTRVFRAAHSEDFVILAFTVLIGLRGVTDRQTLMMAETCEALRAVARKNVCICQLVNSALGITILFLFTGVWNYWSFSWIKSEGWSAEDYASAKADKSRTENPFQGIFICTFIL